MKFGSTIIPKLEELYPGENPRLKLLSLCEERGKKREVAARLGVSEQAIGQMIRRIRKHRALYL